jgi:penicillin amidase
MRRVRFVAVLVVLLFTSGCGRTPSLEQRSRAVLAQTEGRLSIEGLQKPVEVLRDTWGVPHIYAETVEDLFFAQGFVAAQDRLYQMEIWRRTGAGELAEILGPSYAERDRVARLVRYRGDMAQEWASYAPEAKRIIEAFVRGVNAFIRSSGDRLPIEFELLDARPGIWKPEDCLLRIAGLLMTRNAASEIARAQLVARLGPEAAARLLPPDPPTKLEARPDFSLDGIDDRVIQSLQAAIGPVRVETEPGSNNWVVDGTLSATGKPLLANDPHRPVVLPSLRYLTHLVGPGWNVIGAGEPALPGVAAGHNERVAFGFTIVGIDQQDIYVEQTDPQNANRYRWKGEWRDMKIERETIAVRGEKPVEVELKFTEHGPVIYEDPARHRAFVLKWVGSEPGTAGYLASVSLNRVQNWKEFVAAMDRWKVPSENLVYADVDGNIGWFAAGLSPLRPNYNGLLPVPGHDGAREWAGFLPVSELPHVYNPPQHYIATANHNILPRGYRHQLGYEWNPGFRFRRIEEVLQTGKKFTVEDFQRLQHDETSVAAREVIALLKQMPPGGPEMRGRLEKWDGVLSKDSPEAAFYEIWLRKLMAYAVSSEIPAEVRPIMERRINARILLDLLHRAPAAKRHDLLARSLAVTAAESRRMLGEEMASWRWGALHTIRFRHPLSSTEEQRRLFDLGPVERGGDSDTVNNTGGSGYTQSSGASFRGIFDLADWDRSVATSVPGQSGQPGSPHYGDLLPLWAEGKYFPLVYSREAVEKHTKQRLVLEPTM